MPERRVPQRAPLRPAGRPAAAPSSWSASNPVDPDDDEPPTVPIAPAVPAARSSPTRVARPAARPANAPRTATTRPASTKTTTPAAAAPRPAPVGAGAPRTEQTGKPRVDWAEYDAQVYDGPPEWVLYRCWTRLVIDGRWWVRLWQHVLAFLLGRRHQLLWVGISMRSGIARATEHLADKSWRRLIHVFEIDPDVTFATERDAELYEDGRIAAECPRFNKKGNDRAYNPGATHLQKRFHTRHRADWQQQAGLLALAWVAVSCAMTWLLWPADADGFGGGFAAVLNGVATAAAAMMFWRIIRLAVRGAQPTTGQKARLARRR